MLSVYKKKIHVINIYMYKIYVYWVKINANIFMQDFKKKKKNHQ